MAQARPPRAKPTPLASPGRRGQLTEAERQEIAAAQLNEYSLECYGVHLQLRLDASLPAERLAEVLPPVGRPVPWKPEQSFFALRQVEPGDYEVTVARFRLATGLTLDRALDTLDAQVRMALALEAEEYVFVHAGAVALDGFGLILPGRTFAGKSTLVRALIEHGATYYSDEFAVLDANGLLHPYPRPLSIRRAASAAGAEAVDPARLSAAIGRDPVPVGVIASLEYHAQGGLHIQAARSTAGITAILENCAAARSATQRVLNVARQAAAAATTLRGRRGEADEAARALLELALPLGTRVAHTVRPRSS